MLTDQEKNQIKEKAEKREEKELTFLIPRSSLSKCIGHKGRNRERYQKLGKTIRFVETDGLQQYDVRIKN